MKIIGFSGQMGCGKSTAIKFLEDYLDERVSLVKFAQPLYDMQEFIYRRIAPVHARSSAFIKDRKLLQWLGTDWGRNTIGENVWVELWKAEVAVELANGKIVVCDDVRFDNEAEVLKSMGGHIIKLTSDKRDGRIDTTSGLKNHASENGISDKFVDYALSNNDTIKEFQNSLYKAFESIEGPVKKQR